MKKIVSLALAVMMLVSVVPMVYAAEAGGNWQGGTAVTYAGTGTEEYTVTVPAELAPGGNGTVTLSGTWASNRKVTVTADANVVLTNSINAQDTKTLDVTFAGIELGGDNNVAVSDTEDVSVAAIEDALFGTWSGKFNYNVEIGDVAAQLITFTIDRKEYQAEKGMTWGEWVESQYNDGSFSISAGEVNYCEDIEGASITLRNDVGDFVLSDDKIYAGTAYSAMF